MPIDLEMLISSSNSSFYSYPVDTRAYSDSSLSFPKHCVPRFLTKYEDFFQEKTEDDVFRNETSFQTRFYKSTSVISRREHYGARKKKVSFADDKGLNLVEVCEIPGAPKWADDVITLLIGNSKRSVVKEKKWKIAFQYPPWPNEKLIETIENNNVALENISVNEDDHDTLLGTVKVKNLAFEKNVFLRLTFDRWLSYVDIPCMYVEPSEKSSKLNEYDTFCFSSKIPHVASRYEVIEFCVCFRCGDEEYWDSNNGINYRLITENSKSSVSDLQ